MPGGDVRLNDVTIANFNVGVGFELDAACLSFSGVSSITGCDTCEAGILIDEKYMLNIDLGSTPVSSFEKGISILGGSSNNTIRGGLITLNRSNGIHVEPGSEYPAENRFIGIDVIDNGLNGIALLGGFNNQVIGCRIEDNNSNKAAGGYGGIAFLNGSGAIERNRISGNGCSGVYVDEVVEASISGNLIFGNPEGIRVGFVSDVAISNNTITANNAGLVLEDGALPVVSYNILYGNDLSGGPNDIDLKGAFDPANLIENNIGSVNQIDLPPTNVSVNPAFNIGEGGVEDYTLKPTSPCIDGTTVAEPGVDLSGRVRPRGFTWDMGAYESSGFADVDDDGMPDSWERAVFCDGASDCPIEDFLPNGHLDTDGITNLEEFLQGSDPRVPVYVAITEPTDNPYFTDASVGIPVAISGISVNAQSIAVTKTVTVIPDANGNWSASISLGSLDPGGNVILVTAEGTVDNTYFTATDTLTVINDGAAPTISIISPTTEGTYTTTSQSISISGLANDDTQLSPEDQEAYDAIAYENMTTGTTGVASGAKTWNTGPILLSPDTENTIRITATDRFGKQTWENIIITQNSQETGIANVEGPPSVQGNDPVYTDPLDIDLDGYTNDDEIACGSDPVCDSEPCVSGLPALPENTTGSVYPQGHEKEGRPRPDCLNPDIDGDGLPNWWEEQYFGSPTGADEIGNDDDDDFLNWQEYENGTDPKVAQTDAFTLRIIATSDPENPADAWLPKFGQWIMIQATWKPDPENPGYVPANAVFSLKRTSTHPGRAVNDPDPVDMITHHYPDWYIDHYNGFDLGLANAPLEEVDCAADDCFDQGGVVVPRSGQDTYVIYVNCFDFAASANLLVTDDSSGNYIGQMWIPEGSNKNGIGSSWDMDGNPATDNPLDPNTNEPLDPTTLDPNADMDEIQFINSISYNAPQGDDFSNFEEYRGIVFTASDPGFSQPLQHRRLNPYRKDLFIRAEGFDDAVGSPYLVERDWLSPAPDPYYPFRIGKAFYNAGIDVHNTTGWGHDATEDGSFYVYYREGDVSYIANGIDGTAKKVVGTGTNWSGTWPRHEWEFKLAGDPDTKWTPIGSWSVTGDELGLDFAYGLKDPGSYAYLIRKPVPHINILIVRNDQNGLFGGLNGEIKFVSATPPSQQNPLGKRYWRWSTKGYAWCQTTANQSSMYGLAVTLENPLRHYFDDKPYFDGSTWDETDQEWEKTWDGQQWTVITDGKLNPLRLIEDRADQLDPIDGVMGDQPEGFWDGDRRLVNDISGDLSPFDIDRDGLVELPLAVNPYDIPSDSEYSLKEVLLHTITHELAHALAGPPHTNDPICLMYEYSNNWDRADHLSDYYRSILRIHNLTR